MRKTAVSWQLLLDLMRIESTSGDESRMVDFLVNELLKTGYRKNGVLDIFYEGFNNNLIVIKGQPKIAILAHLDTVGYTVGYNHKLIPIGQPTTKTGDKLFTNYPRAYTTTIGKKSTHRGGTIPPGTALSFENPPKEKKNTINGAYLDNRVGMFVALNVLRDCQDVAVVFTAGEETDANGALSCVRYLAEKKNIKTYLISDITFTTKHIRSGGGAVISGRDEMFPDKKLLQVATDIALKLGIRWQLEIEGEGLSDAAGVMRSGTFSKFLFMGAAIDGYHTPYEKIKKSDIDDTIALYTALVNQLHKKEKSK